MAAATASGSSGSLTTSAGLAVLDRLGRPAAVPGHRRHAAGRRFQKHDAEALLLQAGPAGPAAHGEEVGAAVQQRQVPFGDVAEQTYRRPGPPDQLVEPEAIPTGAGDGHRQVGVVRPSLAAARMRVSIPLRGTSRLTLTTSWPPAGKAEMGPGRRLVDGRQGPEPVGVHPGRDLDHRRETAVVADRPAGLRLRVAARRR